MEYKQLPDQLEDEEMRTPSNSLDLSSEFAGPELFLPSGMSSTDEATILALTLVNLGFAVKGRVTTPWGDTITFEKRPLTNMVRNWMQSMCCLTDCAKQPVSRSRRKRGGYDTTNIASGGSGGY
jgi:hypothetical protein